MAEAATDEGRCADLPGEPAQCFGARGGLGGQEVAELFRQMDQDRARFEYADRHVAAGIDQRGDLRIGVDRHEPAGELVRSEEHTSELQSLMRISYAVFCLKKKTRRIYIRP